MVFEAMGLDGISKAVTDWEDKKFKDWAVGTPMFRGEGDEEEPTKKIEKWLWKEGFKEEKVTNYATCWHQVSPEED